MMNGALPFGAEQRLLPEWLPLSFFGFACLCLPLAWLIILIQSNSVVEFYGGFGPILSGLHMFTLGVLMSTAFGASMQMLPVATGVKMSAPHSVTLLLILLLSAIAITLGGFAHELAEISTIGSLILLTSALLYGLLLIRLLLKADSLKLVRLFTLTAAFCLFLAALIGTYLILDWAGASIDNLTIHPIVHAGLATYGFMGFLVLGFSRIMIPMLAVADLSKNKTGFLTFVMAFSALALWIALEIFDISSMMPAVFALGILASLLHGYEMFTTLKKRLRTRLGPEWLLIRFAWISLPLSLLCLSLSWALDNAYNLAQIGFCIAILGWLVSFVLGILQRIIPFLLSMQIARKTGMPELPDHLTPARLLTFVGPCHIFAVICCVIDLATEIPLFISIGSLSGFCSGLLFAAFFIAALKRKSISLNKMTSMMSPQP